MLTEAQEKEASEALDARDDFSEVSDGAREVAAVGERFSPEEHKYKNSG